MNIFTKALPIWIKDKETDLHLRVQFKTIVEHTQHCTVKIATSGMYNLWVNQHFVSYGPARAGKGAFRLDEIDISQYVTEDKNVIVIEVAGYNTNSFAVQNQPSFLQAEVVDGSRILAYTGDHFSARVNPYYYRKVQRYSFQRPMMESYHYDDNTDTFFTDQSAGDETLAAVENKTIIPRYVAYPEYETCSATLLGNGTFDIDEKKKPWRIRFLTDISPMLIGYSLDDLEIYPTDECTKFQFSAMSTSKDKQLKTHQYSLYKLEHESAGFLHLTVTCEEDCLLYVLFDEILSEDGLVDFTRLECSNVVRFDLCEGTHHLKLFDVYCMQYIQLALAKGSCHVENVGFTEFKHPPVKAMQMTDEKLQKIADAATETFRQNAVDIFMDCPSRERAGWLCDSYFTARAEYFLTGKSVIEKSFLENFLFEEEYTALPKGMIPMCYPADFYNGEHIPQWTLWLVLELGEYFERSKDKDLIERFRDKIQNLLSYFATYENEDGLLEDLPGWNFVEWSEANNLVDGVNYPTNMLYSAALFVAGQLYDASYLLKAQKVQAAVLEQSYNGEFFVDQAIRENGILKLTDNITEVCQYYAFFLKTATRESHGQLFQTLIEHFGPGRDCTTTYPHVHPAVPFIGYFLRLDILSQVGQMQELKDNITGYYYDMACKTGTLWEHADTKASCNHGFSSYILCWLDKIERGLK